MTWLPDRQLPLHSKEVDITNMQTNVVWLRGQCYQPSIIILSFFFFFYQDTIINLFLITFVHHKYLFNPDIKECPKNSSISGLELRIYRHAPEELQKELLEVEIKVARHYKKKVRIYIFFKSARFPYLMIFVTSVLVTIKRENGLMYVILMKSPSYSFFFFFF